MDQEDKILFERATLSSTKTEREKDKMLSSEKEEIHHYQYVGNIADSERNHHVYTCMGLVCFFDSHYLSFITTSPLLPIHTLKH